MPISREPIMPGAQQRLAARDVGAGVGANCPETPRGESRSAVARGLGMFDHHDGVGAARHRTAGRDRRRRTRRYRQRRRDTASDDSSLSEPRPAWLRRPRQSRRNAPQNHRHWSGRTAARRSATRGLPPARGRERRPAAVLRFERAVETAPPRNAPAPPRGTGWSGTAPAPRCHDFSALEFFACRKRSWSLPKHVGTGRRARSISLAGTGHREPRIGARNGVGGEIAGSDRHPAIVGPAKSRTISAIPTFDAMFCASGSVVSWPPPSAGEPVQHRQRQLSTRPPAPDPAHRARRSPDGLQFGQSRRSGPAAAQCHGRAVRRARPAHRSSHRCGRRRYRRR